MLHLLLLLACCDDTAQAGAAYREALEALKQSRYEEAVTRLQEALRLQPRETDKLLFRDREGRHADPYHPHLVWSHARVLQARAEADPAARVRLLREAVSHLELTDPPPAAALLDSVKRDLAEAEKAAGTPPEADEAAAALRRRILELCEQEHFEEALAAAEGTGLGAMIEDRRRPALLRYEQAMTLALEAVAVTSAVEKPDAIPRILRPALQPPAVASRPGPRPSWYRDFLALCEGRLPLLRNPAQEPEEAIREAARAFDLCSEGAAEAGWLPGFRASAHLADALRSARLSALDGGADDAQLERLLADLDQALKRRETLLGRCSASAVELRGCREGFLAPPAALGRKIRDRRDARVRLRGDLQAWTAAAEHALSDPTIMGRPTGLRAVSQEGAGLRSRPGWADLEPALRARGLFLGGLLELTAAILEGGLQADLRDPVAALRAARDLDPAAGRDWEARLSPKLRARLSEGR